MERFDALLPFFRNALESGIRFFQINLALFFEKRNQPVHNRQVGIDPKRKVEQQFLHNLSQQYCSTYGRFFDFATPPQIFLLLPYHLANKFRRCHFLKSGNGKLARCQKDEILQRSRHRNQRFVVRHIRHHFIQAAEQLFPLLHLLRRAQQVFLYPANILCRRKGILLRTLRITVETLKKQRIERNIMLLLEHIAKSRHHLVVKPYQMQFQQIKNLVFTSRHFLQIRNNGLEHLPHLFPRGTVGSCPFRKTMQGKFHTQQFRLENGIVKP